MNLRKYITLGFLTGCMIANPQISETYPKAVIIRPTMLETERFLRQLNLNPLLPRAGKNQCNLVQATNDDLNKLSDRIQQALDAANQILPLFSGLREIDAKRTDLKGVAKLTFLYQVLDRLITVIKDYSLINIGLVSESALKALEAVEFFNKLPHVSDRGKASVYYVINRVPIGHDAVLSKQYMAGMRAAALAFSETIRHFPHYAEFYKALETEQPFSSNEIRVISTAVKSFNENLKTLGYFEMTTPVFDFKLWNTTIEALMNALRLQNTMNKLMPEGSLSVSALEKIQKIKADAVEEQFTASQSRIAPSNALKGGKPRFVRPVIDVTP